MRLGTLQLCDERAKAQHSIKRSGPFLRRDLVHIYSAPDKSKDRQILVRIVQGKGVADSDILVTPRRRSTRSEWQL